jgi:hypothetical protein
MFPVRYGLDSYILFISNSVFKGLMYRSTSSLQYVMMCALALTGWAL